MPNAALATIATRVERFITRSSCEEFDVLALAVHAYQRRHNPAYRRFLERLDRPPPRAWNEIPAVPASAFRASALSCGPAERVYESSGTSQGPARRARHHVPRAAVYRAAALAGFQAAVLPAGARRPFLVAAPERATHPTSSLGEMVSWLRDVHDSGTTASFLTATGLDVAALATALDRLEPDRPVLLLAVTSALLFLADHATRTRRTWHLPPGSIVLDTGGCKGYPAEVPRSTVLARYRDALGVEPSQVVNEYGMTELCSQLYARGHGPLRPPPWMRTVVCDPATGQEQPVGAAGLLRHFDLANVGSVLAIQTEDVGRQVEGGIALLGRVAHGETRGCSLLVAP